MVPLSDAVMVQLYRGELGRSDRWRMRLDTTSNWALTTAAATISYGFGNSSTSHVVLLVGLWMVVSFLLVEARRYRYYDLWIHRVRLIEDGYWAPVLRHEPLDPDALKELALELERPQLQLSLFSALTTRMNRVYGPLMLVMMLTWMVKVYSHPAPTQHLAELAERAQIGFIPGALVMMVMGVMVLAVGVMLVSSGVLRPPVGELRPRRARKMALWEAFARPYAVKSPRRQHVPSPGSRPLAPH